jgi:hypothetical protein
VDYNKITPAELHRILKNHSFHVAEVDGHPWVTDGFWAADVTTWPNSFAYFQLVNKFNLDPTEPRSYAVTSSITPDNTRGGINLADLVNSSIDRESVELFGIPTG